jgi:hypothetical protein
MKGWVTVEIAAQDGCVCVELGSSLEGQGVVEEAEFRRRWRNVSTLCWVF